VEGGGGGKFVGETSSWELDHSSWCASKAKVFRARWNYACRCGMSLPQLKEWAAVPLW